MPIDYRTYPPNWPEIRSRIRARAGERCEQCGVENHTYRGSTRIVLTVAHLNHDVTDNRDENLLALCQAHHLALDAEQHRLNAAETRRRKRVMSGQLELGSSAGEGR